MIRAYRGVFKLSQQVLHVRPRDPEEISQPGPIMGIKVVRNLLEEVGKGERHDHPCARDFTHPSIDSLSTQCCSGDPCLASPLSLTLSYRTMALQPSLRPFLLGNPAAPHTLDIFRE